MKAVVINQPGDSSVLNIVERPIPVPDKTHSVMKIHAFGVHRYEVLTRAGGSPDVKFPRVIGVEAVGEVYATDPASGLKVGQRVFTINGGFGRAFDGSEQEYALLPNDRFFSADYDGDWVKFAQYPETFYTAFGSLKTLKLQAGQELLIRGGTTSVGLAMLKLAKAEGLKVTATTRKPERLQQLLDFGADHAILDTNNELQTDHNYDGIVDMVGTVSLSNSLQHLNVGATCCMMGLLAGEWVLKEFSPFDLVDKYLTTFGSDDVDQDLVDEMFTLINDHQIEIPITKVFPLSEIAAAQDFVMQNPSMGEVIVSNDL
ncbi:zinc-binding dehydrogenase [Lapidilactobacillus wuchangensis]|uniref:zinc-binding dehydrogenase n=1 Tax=Lapidilactobacillus wuchangensis TaxID=2486001 RepID=UPI000F771669|nr:zinc-binding dehydrogenase [Lapidilactobacillus wuchangensis]